jgi:hypothetical protein
MKNKSIDLGIYAKDFNKVSSIINIHLSRTCKFLGNEGMAIITSMLTMLEINKKRDLDEIALKKNAIKYANNINDYLKNKPNIPEHIGEWILLFAVAVSGINNENEQLKRELESLIENEEQIDNIILDGFVFYIKESIGGSDLELINLIQNEIKDLCFNKNNKKLNHETLQKLISARVGIINQLKENFKNKKNDRAQAKYKSLFYPFNLIRSLFIRQQIRHAISTAVPGLSPLRKYNNIANTIAGSLFTKITNKILLHKKRSRENEIKKPLKSKRSYNAEQLWNMLNSHNPVCADRIPVFLSGNNIYRQEARRLRCMGVGLVNSHIEAHKNIDEGRGGNIYSLSANAVSNKKINNYSKDESYKDKINTISQISKVLN